MDKDIFENLTKKYCEESAGNRFSDFEIFEEPLFSYGSPDDTMYESFRDNADANLSFLMLPKEWLDSAKTVISVFLPFSERVRKSNREDGNASAEWAVGRVEGQKFISELSAYLLRTLREYGFDAVVPSIDKRMRSIETPNSNEQFPEGTCYTSNWSERHNAFICGMGTFGLSKGIITQKGMAGRFFTVITEAEFPVTERNYTDLYERCIKCCACVKRCPAGAIDGTKGKNHPLCAKVVHDSTIILAPRYGCGKCQVGVPCEHAIPKKRK